MRMSVLIDSPSRAARLARTIASDISLYMQSNVTDNAEAKRLEVERQIEHGRVYFKSRVSAELDGDAIYAEVVESLL